MQWFLQFDGCCGSTVYCTDGKFWWKVIHWSDGSMSRVPCDVPVDGPELTELQNVPWDLDNDFSKGEEE